MFQLTLMLAEYINNAPIDWLRNKGITARNPLHALRKEAGSLVNARAGIHAASRFLRHAEVTTTVRPILGLTVIWPFLFPYQSGISAKKYNEISNLPFAFVFLLSGPRAPATLNFVPVAGIAWRNERSPLKGGIAEFLGLWPSRGA